MIEFAKMPTKTTKVKGHCPRCGPETLAEVASSALKKEDLHPAGVFTEDTYRLLCCCGCEAIYFQKEHIFSEDYEFDENGEPDYRSKISHWPIPPKRMRPEWFLNPFVLTDRQMCRLLEEVYTATDHDLRILAAIGVRTVFDRASELLGVDPNKPFAHKVEALLNEGHISLRDQKLLAALTDAGSAAAHRGWSPSASQLNGMIDVIERFIHGAFVIDNHLPTLASNIPKRPDKGSS